MATAKAPATNDEAYLNERVEVVLFKDDKDYKDDYTVAINGKVWLIQRGKRVKVPRFVAMQIDTSQRQDIYTAKLIEKELEKSRLPDNK